MKNTMKKIGLLLAVVVMTVLFTVSVSAKEIAPTGQCGENVYWEFEDSTGELIVSGTGDMYDYGYHESPFHFSDIKHLIINNAVTSIGSNAFYDCTELASIVIGSDIEYVGADAFHGCYMISSVNISNLSSWCATNFSNLFSNPLGYSDNLYLNSALVTDIVIPNDVKKIGSGVFLNYSKLKSITISSNVTSIGANAFWNCKNIKFGNNISSIGDYAFSACTKLSHVAIPNSVTHIGAHAFYGCTRLSDIKISENITSISDGLFYGCSLLKEVFIPKSVESIGHNAFYRCLSLEKIVFENSEINLESKYICHTDIHLNGITPLQYLELCDEYNEAILSGDNEKLNEVVAEMGLYTTEGVVMPLSNLTIYGYNPSTAKVYAEANNIPFKAINDSTNIPSTPDTPSAPTDDCSCNCHAGGIKAFFFKIMNFFQKLFGQNKICACGVKH